jgi:hypothetical protein
VVKVDKKIQWKIFDCIFFEIFIRKHFLPSRKKIDDSSRMIANKNETKKIIL